MNRAAVRSSNIRSVGYDGQTVTLEVEFLSAIVYQYSGAPATAHAGLLNARSKGTYFHDYLRNRYPCRQVR